MKFHANWDNLHEMSNPVCGKVKNNHHLVIYWVSPKTAKGESNCGAVAVLLKLLTCIPVVDFEKCTIKLGGLFYVYF